MDPEVMRSNELAAGALEALLSPYGLQLQWLDAGTPIPGSYWGETEAGLVGDRLYLRPDTPVHSALHEACHYICVDASRRATLHTDANGCDTEEMGVCYLQALLAEQLRGYSRARLFADMDAWGYNFVLGSAAAWFEGDSADALAFLQQYGLVASTGRPGGRCRA
ncbi:hypothetical protein D0B54_17435 [Solimonas sp. K1W22B-7]|uniref:hypothetical protein n=1 Tax=Solimonas sp. K1W22B-7 TaxID=2303331 RepID=UPI000E32D9E5|nr:hypothetical protein [Solimonas sp. K1W22B-7]AXQ30345.1 hypothetical protein D0B54_17435 [Solimonas sp. K1W22B-7]